MPLLRKIIIALLFTAIAFGAPTLVTVSQVIYRADGSPAQGTVFVEWQSFDTAMGEHVQAGSLQKNLTNTGLLSVALAPNVGASPSTTRYTVTYRLDLGQPQKVSWTVPDSGPVTVTAVQSTTIVGPSSIVALSQIQGSGASLNDCLVFNGTVWTHASCSGVSSVGSVFGRSGTVVAVSGDYTAAQVTNAVDSTAMYSNPGWITALAGSKITGLSYTMMTGPTGGGTQCLHTNNAGAISGTGSDCGAGGGAVSSVFGRTGVVVAVTNDYTAAQVNHAVDTTSSYSNPGWITALAASKLTGLSYTMMAGPAGGGTQCVQSDNAGALSGTGTGCGTASAAGSTNDIQVNNAGAFSGGRGTLDSSGNQVIAGTETTGSGSGAAGAHDFIAGTVSAVPANSFGIGAGPTMTTSVRLQSPDAVPAAHSLMVIGAPASNRAPWVYKVAPDCHNTGDALNFTQSTDSLSCQNIAGGGGGSGAALFSTTNSTTVTATSPTTLIGTVTGSSTIAANTFTAGQVIQVFAEGYYSTPATPASLTITLNVGGTIRITTGAVIQIASVTNGTWRLNCMLTTRTTGVSGTQIANCIFEGTGVSLTPGESALQTSSTWTVDTTATQALDVVATWSTTTGAPTITSTNVAAWIPGAASMSNTGCPSTTTTVAGMVCLEAHTASSSTELDFTSCITGAFDDYEIRLDNIVFSTTLTLQFQMSTNGGSSYDTSASYSYVYHYDALGSSGTIAAASQTSIPTRDVGSAMATRGGFNGRFTLYNPGGSLGKVLLGQVMIQTTTSTANPVVFHGGGFYDSATAVNAFRVIASTGNFTSGVVRCYGVQH